MVSVPAAVVSSAGVTTLPVTVAGISVAIGQPQKAAGMSAHLLKYNTVLNSASVKVGCSVSSVGLTLQQTNVMEAELQK